MNWRGSGAILRENDIGKILLELRKLIMDTPNYCPHCGKPIIDNPHFCPDCGSNLSGKSELSTKSIIIAYLVSFLIPPSGFYWWLKFRRSKDEKEKKVGKISLVLTLISTVITVVMIIMSLQLANDILDSSDLMQYDLNGLGL